MKKLLFILLFLESIYCFSQKRERSTEFGGFGGVSYYFGELNPPATGQFRFIHPSLGILLRRNFNSRFAFKTNLYYGKISGSDSKAGISVFEKNRNLAFNSILIELSEQAEFMFYNFKVMDLNSYFSPYVFAGISVFYFNPKPKGAEKNYLPIAPAFPFGTGVKLKFSHRYLIGAEWGFRKTFTDYLDDVSTVYPTGSQRGDSKNRDWYSFAGITFTVRLGEKPNDCYYE